MTPEDRIRAFLAALEARDLAMANTHLHPKVEMLFPGGAAFYRLEELIDWARPRYRHVAKLVERIDVAGTTAFVQGTLYGQWPDGSAFEGIRFADWFEFEEGLIYRQRVWNDLAEIRLDPGAGAETL